MSDQAFLDEFIIQRGAIETLARMEKEIGDVLGDNGCDCTCGHGWEDHEDDCDRCLACRVSEPLMLVGRIIRNLNDAANHGSMPHECPDERERRVIANALTWGCEDRMRSFDFIEMRTGVMTHEARPCGKCKVCKIGEAIRVGNYAGARGQTA